MSSNVYKRAHLAWPGVVRTLVAQGKLEDPSEDPYSYIHSEEEYIESPCECLGVIGGTIVFLCEKSLKKKTLEMYHAEACDRNLKSVVVLADYEFSIYTTSYRDNEMAADGITTQFFVLNQIRDTKIHDSHEVKCSIMSKEDLANFRLATAPLPVMLKDDATAVRLGAKPGDIVKTLYVFPYGTFTDYRKVQGVAASALGDGGDDDAQ